MNDRNESRSRFSSFYLQKSTFRSKSTSKSSRDSSDSKSTSRESSLSSSPENQRNNHIELLKTTEKPATKTKAEEKTVMLIPRGKVPHVLETKETFYEIQDSSRTISRKKINEINVKPLSPAIFQNHFTTYNLNQDSNASNGSPSPEFSSNSDSSSNTPSSQSTFTYQSQRSDDFDISDLPIDDLFYSHQDYTFSQTLSQTIEIINETNNVQNQEAEHAPYLDINQFDTALQNLSIQSIMTSEELKKLCLLECLNYTSSRIQNEIDQEGNT